MVTSEQVAKLAGVSRATVSRALNGSANVSEETRQRILEAIASLGYEPNVVAQNLARQRSRVIAFALFTDDQRKLMEFEQTQHYFYLGVISAVEHAITSAGYDLFFPARAEDGSYGNYLRTLQSRRVAGVIAISIAQSDPRIQALVNSNLPTVFIDNMGQGKRATYVKSDNLHGGRMAMEYLLQLGHRRIAIMPGNTADLSGAERLLGCQQGLAKAGLVADPDLICVSDWTTEDAYHATIKLLKQRRDFTAIAAGSDMMAMGVLRALHEYGIRVPEEVSVIGFDDLDISRFMEPPLTTVRQDRLVMSQSAVQKLITMIEEGETPAPLTIPMQLVVRASTGPAPA